MRILLIVSFLFSLVLIALLIIMMEQNKVLVLLNNKTAQLKIQSDELDFQLTNEDFIKATVEKLVTLGNTLVEDTEGAVAKLLPEVEKAKTENDACQADKVNFFFLAASAFQLLKKKITLHFTIASQHMNNEMQEGKQVFITN